MISCYISIYLFILIHSVLKWFFSTYFFTIHEALIRLQEEILPITNESVKTKADRISVLCIAYYNVATEQEFLKKLLQARKTFITGYRIAETYLGVAHSITSTIKSSLHLLSSKLDDHLMREENMERKKMIAKMSPAEFGRIKK